MPFLFKSISIVNTSYVDGNGRRSSCTQDNTHALPINSKPQSGPRPVIKADSELTKAARLAPRSKWTPLCHEKLDEVVRDSEGHVVANWNWPSEKIRRKVIGTQFGRAAALCFPLAENDRIDLICRLCMILVLVDDVLDHLSFEAGKAYNEKLITIMSGDVDPDRNIPAEWLLSDLWDEMRAQDAKLAAETLQGTCNWFRAMTEADRNVHSSLGSYLDYRERDVGMEMLSTMVRYAMNIHLTTEEIDLIRPIEQNFVRQYCMVNDVCSWEKEVKVAQASKVEGAVICSGVQVLAGETGLPIPSVKRLLWALAREYSDSHDAEAAELEAGGCSERVSRYMEGLRCLMAGNEEWCLTSARYNDDVKC